MPRTKTTATPPRPHAMQVRLSDDERRTLVALATRRRITLADAVRRAIMGDA